MVARPPHRKHTRRNHQQAKAPAGEDFATLKMASLPQGPWLYRKMIRPPDSRVPNGALVDVRDRKGKLVGRGILNRQSEVMIRMLTGPKERDPFEAILKRRLKRAQRMRTDLLNLERRTDAYRLVHGEGDGLSGLVVDRYGPVCVVAVHSIGYVYHGEVVEKALLRLQGVEQVYFRADDQVCRQEGFRLPDLPAGVTVTIRENHISYEVNLSEGHKTGFFLDQRENRSRLGGLAKGRRVLDLCTNSGGFALSAVKGSAKVVTAVDLDEKAIAMARRNARLNKMKVKWVHGDLFDFLRDRAGAEGQWPLVVLDPPRLAKGRQDLDKALHRYRDMNRLAMGAVEEDGVLLTCSCSSIVTEQAFIGVVTAAARQANRTVRVLGTYGAAQDHPWALDYPEGRYLKALLLQVS